MEVPIYLVLLPTGHFIDDDTQAVIVIDVKLTRAAAEGVAQDNPGAFVEKMLADKHCERLQQQPRRQQ